MLLKTPKNSACSSYDRSEETVIGDKVTFEVDRLLYPHKHGRPYTEVTNLLSGRASYSHIECLHGYVCGCSGCGLEST